MSMQTEDQIDQTEFVSSLASTQAKPLSSVAGIIGILFGLLQLAAGFLNVVCWWISIPLSVLKVCNVINISWLVVSLPILLNIGLNAIVFSSILLTASVSNAENSTRDVRWYERLCIYSPLLYSLTFGILGLVLSAIGIFVNTLVFNTKWALGAKICISIVVFSSCFAAWSFSSIIVERLLS